MTHRWLLVLLAPAWPLGMHAAVTLGRPDVAVWVLSALLILPAVTGMLRHGRPGRVGSLLMLAAAALALAAPFVADRFLVLAPALMQAGLMLFFVLSLRPGQVAVVSRLAALVRGGELPPAVLRYTRVVTLAWALFFLGVMLLGLWLGRNGVDETWSWYTHFGVPLMTLAFFLAEYAVRRLLLHRYMDYGMHDYLRRLLRIDYRRAFLDR